MTPSRKKPGVTFWATVVVVMGLHGCGENQEAADLRAETDRLARAARSAAETASDSAKRRDQIEKLRQARIGK